MMDQLASMMRYEGEYVTMVGSMTSESHMNWADAAVARQQEMYPNMTLVPTGRVSSEHDSEVSYQRTMELLQMYPNLRGIQGTGSFDAPGAARAIRDLDLVGEVFVISATIPSEIRDFLHEGVMQGGALWDPALTAQAMLNLGIMMYNGETITTGADLGIPGYDNVIVEGTLIIGDGSIAITPDNVDDFDF
jgi:simple sugar transport system substrate-binding protein